MINYVYTLSYRGKVFYVGCTKNPIRRFWSHTSLNNPKTKNFIIKILNYGVVPIFNVIGHSIFRNVALSIEKSAIKKYIFNGNILVNNNLTGVKYFGKHIELISCMVLFTKYDGQACLALRDYINNNIKPVPEGYYINYRNEYAPMDNYLFKIVRKKHSKKSPT